MHFPAAAPFHAIKTPSRLATRFQEENALTTEVGEADCANIGGLCHLRSDLFSYFGNVSLQQSFFHERVNFPTSGWSKNRKEDSKQTVQIHFERSFASKRAGMLHMSCSMRSTICLDRCSFQVGKGVEVPTLPDRGLLVDLHWIEKMLSGDKTWEIRGDNCNVRERIGALVAGKTVAA